MGEENRLYPRFKFKRPAQCAYLETFPETFDVIVVDIGPEGFGFVCDEKLAAGTTIYFLMDLGRDETVKLLIKIRWARKLPNSQRFHVGAKIYDANNEDLEKFVKVYYRQLVPRGDRKKKILLIEHDRGAASSLQAALAKRRYDVICAYDGESGFSQYLSEQPDLVILSMVLPKLDGYGVCRKIRKLQADETTPIMMLAAKKKIADKVISDSVGVQKCLVKPFEMDQLLQVVSDLMIGSDIEDQQKEEG